MTGPADVAPVPAPVPATASTSVRFLRGIGPRRAALLERHGIVTLEDLAYHLPIRYEERGRPARIVDVREGDLVTITARVVQSALNRTRRRGFTIFQAVVDDGSAALRVTCFNQPYLTGVLTRGATATFHGRIGRSRRTSGLQLENPSFEVHPDGAVPLSEAGPGLTPVHAPLPGFTARGLRLILHGALDALPDPLPPVLPAGLEAELHLLPRREALRRVQFPPADACADEYLRGASEAHQRLARDELFAMQAAFRIRRRRLGERPASRRYDTSREVGDHLRALLPFRLTPGQRAAFRDVVADLKRPVPMARLLQGDVGSGKTIIALLAMLLAAESGLQAALMAPTEILAEQHARSFQALLQGRREVALLSGSLPAKDRRRVVAGLASGAIRLVIGTHALLQGEVAFRELGLIVVDEQHRFGVAQRGTLAAKGGTPDVLVMSATPIPRTLALTVHGDLDVTVIPDRPPGRHPIRTVVRDEADREAILRFLDEEIGRGGRAYVVHPSIDETADADLAAATVGAERLRDALPHRHVALLHGRLPTAERDRAVQAFARGDVDVLVATTVVEVGLDVPEASVMLIEDAARFGLSQLHQLRGRVGRGKRRSWCILLKGPEPTEQGRQRLAWMERTDDGFVLAEADLAMRGAGEFFGVRQAGARDLRIADPVRDADLLLAVRAEAIAWIDGLSATEMAQDPLVRAITERWLDAVERSASG